MHNETKGKVTQNVLGNSEGEQIKSVFRSLGIISWESFVTTRLPILNLPKNILKALRQGKIAYTKGIAIAKVKDEKQQDNLLTEAIESNLSLKEIKERIKQLQPKPEESNSPKQRVNNLVKGLNKSKLWEKEPKKWQKVSKLIEKIESFLEE